MLHHKDFHDIISTYCRRYHRALLPLNLESFRFSLHSSQYHFTNRKRNHPVSNAWQNSGFEMTYLSSPVALPVPHTPDGTILFDILSRRSQPFGRS